MHSLSLIVALGLVSQAYCAAFIKAVEYRPRNNVVERAPAPPEITVTSIPENVKREYNPATELHIASQEEVPFVGTFKDPVAPVTSKVDKSTDTFIAIPTQAASDSGILIKGDYIVELAQDAIDKLTAAAEEIGKSCTMPVKRNAIGKRSNVCTLQILQEAQATEGNYVGTIRLIGQSLESWEAEQAAGAALAPVIPAGAVFLTPTWSTIAALSAAQAVFMVFVGAYLFNNKAKPASLNIEHIGTNTKDCKSSQAARCTKSCEQSPYASDYQIAYTSTCSESCQTFTACDAKGASKTTTVPMTSTYTTMDGEETGDPWFPGSDFFQQQGISFNDIDMTPAYCKDGLFDDIDLPKPSCNPTTGSKFVSQTAAINAVSMYCGNKDMLKGNKNLGFVQWYNTNSDQEFSFEIDYDSDQDFQFSQSACETVFATLVNGCSLPGNDNKNNNKFGGSMKHPCGPTFKFSPSPESKLTCDAGATSSGVQSNAFTLNGGMYKQYCDQVGKNQGSALTWVTDNKGNKMPLLKARAEEEVSLEPTKVKRTPPPDVNNYKDYQFGWIFTPSSTKGSCQKSCSDAFNSLAQGPCGRAGGEQNTMAKKASIDVGCGTYEYSIWNPTSPPPPKGSVMVVWDAPPKTGWPFYAMYFEGADFRGNLDDSCGSNPRPANVEWPIPPATGTDPRVDDVRGKGHSPVRNAPKTIPTKFDLDDNSKNCQYVEDTIGSAAIKCDNGVKWNCKVPDQGLAMAVEKDNGRCTSVNPPIENVRTLVMYCPWGEKVE